MSFMSNNLTDALFIKDPPMQTSNENENSHQSPQILIDDGFLPHAGCYFSFLLISEFNHECQSVVSKTLGQARSY